MKENELIAKYMGLSPIEGNYYHPILGKARIIVWMKPPTVKGAAIPLLYSNEKKHYKFKHKLKYDKIWGEILPVVQRVKRFHLASNSSEAIKKENVALKNAVRMGYLQCKIAPLHKALVEYIEFINKQTK